MLFTRCPNCETTFRITDESLKKANGQVRCGRCSTVFNAFAELHDPAAKSFDKPSASLSPRPAPPPPPPAPGDAAPPQNAAPPDAASPPAAAAPTPSPGDAEPALPEAIAESIGARSLDDIRAEAALATVEDGDDIDDTAATAEHEVISANEIDRVLARDLPTLPPTAAVWPPFGSGELEGPAQERRWTVAAAVALLVLGVQVLHHFRTDVAGHPTFGPLIQGTYALFGSELTPHWDVEQYQILDWVATADPSARGVGSLKITARIQNRGPLQQPYPAVQLKLKDRWEEAVGSRMFTPAEYLPSDAPRDRLMSPGETARAEIEVVDPGPDAYGFELDVCIEVEASLVTCGSDEVFL
jgi:predicted Zn finger-like uncharacterized protein